MDKLVGLCLIADLVHVTPKAMTLSVEGDLSAELTVLVWLPQKIYPLARTWVHLGGLSRKHKSGCEERHKEGRKANMECWCLSFSLSLAIYSDFTFARIIPHAMDMPDLYSLSQVKIQLHEW